MVVFVCGVLRVVCDVVNAVYVYVMPSCVCAFGSGEWFVLCVVIVAFVCGVAWGCLRVRCAVWCGACL